MTQSAHRNLLPPPPNMLTLRVVGRTVVGRNAVSLFLAPPGRQTAPAAYLPGQFVTLAIPTPSETLYRSYSLCGPGLPNQPWEITIKKVQQGRVSSWLHDQVPVGATLYASMPRGSFVLPTPLRADVPLIFVAAGSGITPIRGMIRALANMPARHRPHVQLHYASSTPEDILYRQDWDTLDPQRVWLQQFHYVSGHGKPLNSATVMQLAAQFIPRAHWYVCGPDSLRNDISSALTNVGVPMDRIHVEVFATSQRPRSLRLNDQNARARATGPQIYIQETGATIRAATGETILETLEQHGYHPDFSCRSGSCGTCRLRVLAGRVQPGAAVALSPDEARAGMILSCVAHPLTDITLLSGGRAPARGFVPGRTVATGGASRAAARAIVRAACVGVVGLGLMGTWGLTNHRPNSWSATASTSASAGTTTQPPGGTSTKKKPPKATATPRPTATPSGGGYGGGNPPIGNPGGGGSPAPTDTPQPAPTDTPQPPPPPPTPVPPPIITSGQS